MKVVDLGCGTGIPSPRSSYDGAEETVGIDVDGGALKVAENEQLDLKFRINVIPQDGCG